MKNETIKEKNWFAKHPVLSVIIGLILLGIVTSGKSGEKPKQMTNESIKTEEVEKSWVTVAELKGNANKGSDTFNLTGNKKRLTYTFSGDTMIVGSIYVLREGTELMVDGGIPEVMVTEGGTDSTILRRSEGEYYLQVVVANTNYTVVIEEEK